MRAVLATPLTALLIVLPVEQVLAQEDGGEAASWTTPRAILSPSFRYQKQIDAWDIAYFGATGEVRVSEHVSFSGSIFFGKGPGDVDYGHAPLAGIALMLPFLIVGQVFEDFTGRAIAEGRDDLVGPYLKLLLMENTHFNIRVGEAVVVSPYVNFLSLDAEEGSAGSEFLALASGLGANAKIFLSDRFVLIPDIALKRFFVIQDSISGDSDRFGFALTFQAGYVF